MNHFGRITMTLQAQARGQHLGALLRIVDDNLDDLPADFEIAQGASFQLQPLVVDALTGVVLDNDPAGTWTGGDPFLGVSGAGLVTIVQTAPVGQAASLTVEVTHNGELLTETLFIQIAQGTPPAPGDFYLIIATGDAQTGPVLEALSGNIVVRLFDVNDLPVVGELLSFEPSDGGLVFEAPTFVTVAGGYAEFKWALGDVAGPQTLTINERFGSSIVLNATATAVAPSTRNIVLVSGGSQTADVSMQLANPVVIRVEDGSGTPIASAPLAWTPPSGGSISGQSSATDGSGLGQATVTLGPTAGAQTINVSTSSGSGASLPVAAFASSGTPVEGEIALPALVRQNIGPLIAIDTSNNFANVPPPFQGWFRRYRSPAWEPKSWTRFLNWVPDGFPLSSVIADIQYGGGRLEWALCTGDPIGAAATDESDTTVEYWSKFRRMVRQAMATYYKPNTNWWGANEPYRTVLPHIYALTVLDPTWDQASLVTSRMNHTTAPPNTVDPFNYFIMINQNSGPRVPYTGLALLRGAIIQGLPYQNVAQAGVSPAFSSYLEAYRWCRDRILSSPAISPIGFPAWFLKSPAHVGDPPYMTMPLARELLLGDQYIESHQASRDFAHGVCGRWVDFYLDVLEPMGRGHLPITDRDGVGSFMSWQPYHIGLVGTYIDAWYMCWQDTGEARFRDAAREILTNGLANSWVPHGLGAGKEIGEAFWGMFRAYAMESGVPWRA